MPSYSWAKIYCDLVRHPLLRDRPDCDVRLVVGLILEAKEHTDDGVIRNLTARSARDLCHIKAGVKAVQAGLDYLVAEGWLIPHPGLAYEIRDFRERQKKDVSTERVREWRKRHGNAEPETHETRSIDVTNVVTKRTGNGADTDTEKEVEKSKSKDLAGGLLSQPPTAPVWQAYSAAFEKRYGAPPVRNAKVSGQLAQFLKRVAAQDAPSIAEFYLTHPAAKYASNGHPVGLLLQDAEKLAVEWVTGQKINGHTARREEKTAANVDGWTSLLKTEPEAKRGLE